METSCYPSDINKDTCIINQRFILKNTERSLLHLLNERCCDELMEVNAVLEKDGTVQAGLWYVISPGNEGPCARVGHTCCVVRSTANVFNDCAKDEEEASEKMLIIGGANPDGAFDDSYILDIGAYKWLKYNVQGLPRRYEHSAFVQEGEKCCGIVVFGGAQMDTNLNDIWLLDSGSWCLSVPSGQAPSQRTCHSAAAINNKLYIFGGGQSGAQPISDDKLHVYDAKENRWSQPLVKGKPPQVRHGHVMVAFGNDVYIHGGMAGAEIFADLWKLAMVDEEPRWWQCEANGDVPSKRAAHAGCVTNRSLYLFGGMNEHGALDDLYSLCIDSMLWQRIRCDGPPPHCRLDHTMCSVTVFRNVDGDEMQKVKQTFLVVFGGMDTTGQIFDDCMAILVED